MIKNLSKSLCIMLILFLLMGQSTMLVAASTNEIYSITKEYLPDGSYYETEIRYTPTRATITGASKTTTYKNNSGDALWYVRVTANFTFNGSSSSCTSASCSANSYSSSWKILKRESNRSGNTAYAAARAGNYVAGKLIGTHDKTVSLTFDKNGNLS